MTLGFLSRLQGNARTCLTFELLFLLPYTLITTYATIYMYEMGLSETTIGWIITLGLVVQVFSAWISGYLTDRLGRRKALMYFDIISWSIPLLIWALAQNVWFFVIAALVNGLVRIPHTAFSCLLVEETPLRDRTYVFMVLQFLVVVGGLFAPIGGLVVMHFDLIPGIRWMYVFAFVSITLMIFPRHILLKETEIGLRKMKESQGISVNSSFTEYVRVTRKLLHTPPLLMVFSVYMLFTFQLTLKNTYLSLYFVDELQLRSEFISIFPALTSVVMLIAMVFMVPKIPPSYTNQVMIWGFLISVLSIILLIIAKPGDIVLLLVSTVFSALGVIMTYPYLEAAVANEMNDEDRAHSVANLWVVVLMFTAPSGIIGGWAYHVDPRIPFILIGVALVFSMLVMIAFHFRQVNSEGGSTI